MKGPEEKQQINSLIEKLSKINEYLKPAQLQVGYRTRDEIILYTLHAKEIKTYFVTKDGQDVDPFDLAILMKILPELLEEVIPFGK